MHSEKIEPLDTWQLVLALMHKYFAFSVQGIKLSMLSQGHGLDLLEFCHHTGRRPSFCTVIGVHVCFQTLTSALKELTLVTQPPYVPTLQGHMSARATLVTMEMEETVQVSHVITIQRPVI